MELEIMYPQLIIIVLLFLGLLLFLRKKDDKFTKGVIIANTKYVKKTDYYKRILMKYKIYKYLLNIVCIFLIIVCAILSARLYSYESIGEEVNNRDIMLCMDISGSVNSLNKDLVKSMKETVQKLKTERLGITVFDSVPLNLVPLTTDYSYVISVLDQIEKALKTKYNPFNPDSSSFIRDFIYAGVMENDSNKRGYSLVGDGLAYCASSIKNNDKRSKAIILTTDNEVVGKQIVDIQEAAQYCKDNKIKVFAIGTEEINEVSKNELINVSDYTKGKYYDIKSDKMDNIANEIQKLGRNAMIKNSYSYTHDYPNVLIYLLLALFPLLMLLSWRIKI